MSSAKKPGRKGETEAIKASEPARPVDRNFAVAAGFERNDDERRPTSEIPDDELLTGFGEWP